MSNRDPEKVNIGHWYSMCCILDLYKIENEEDLEDVRSTLQQAIDDPMEDWGMHTWSTLEEAIADMVAWGETLDDRPDLKEILGR